MQADSKAAAGQLEHIWGLAGGNAAALDAVTLTGDEPALPGIYNVGVQAQAAIAATGLAAAEVHKAHGGGAQQVSVSMRHAAASFRSEQYIRLDGKPARDFFDSIHLHLSSFASVTDKWSDLADPYFRGLFQKPLETVHVFCGGHRQMQLIGKWTVVLGPGFNPQAAPFGMVLLDSGLVPASPAIHQDHPVTRNESQNTDGMF